MSKAEVEVELGKVKTYPWKIEQKVIDNFIKELTSYSKNNPIRLQDKFLKDNPNVVEKHSYIEFMYNLLHKWFGKYHTVLPGDVMYCQSQTRRRSVVDTMLVTKYYYPNVDFEDMFLWFLEMYAANKMLAYWCCTRHILIMYEIGSDIARVQFNNGDYIRNAVKNISSNHVALNVHSPVYVDFDTKVVDIFKNAW